ncbi:class II lanthipeptide, LchA2/BrtA2 family [Bacillus paramycoides]|nr:class II lanthipeptide, LchA2/BrtA2 family [Bacillus paramycoides]
MAWKNPEMRSQEVLANPVGEVSEEELMAAVGGSDVNPRTTWPCVVVITSTICGGK